MAKAKQENIMKVCGFISEYNPYHNGHLYQFKESMKKTNANASIIVMSGDFVQRGEPAIISKYKRAEIAIDCGADLVIEIPSILATASAEHFAFGAVSILNATGIVDYLSFGSESGNIDDLDEIAELIYDESDIYKSTLKTYLKEGIGFAQARSKTIKYLYVINPSVLDKSNNILGIEYLKSLKRLDSDIIPITIKRIGDAYNDKKVTTIASATGIRELIVKEHFSEISSHIQRSMYQTLQSEAENMIFFDDIYKYVRYKIITSTPEELKKYQDVTEGIENTLKKNIHFTSNFNELFSFMSRKRFTTTKLKRALLNIYLGNTKELLELSKTTTPYIKVLAFNKTGTKLLKEMKHKNNDLAIIVNNKKGFKKLDPKSKKIFLNDMNASLLYNHLIGMKTGKIKNNDYQKRLHPL